MSGRGGKSRVFIPHRLERCFTMSEFLHSELWMRGMRKMSLTLARVGLHVRNVDSSNRSLLESFIPLSFPFPPLWLDEKLLEITDCISTDFLFLPPSIALTEHLRPSTINVKWVDRFVSCLPFLNLSSSPLLIQFFFGKRDRSWDCKKKKKLGRALLVPFYKRGDVKL